MEKITVKIDGMMCGMCESHMNDTFRQNFKVKKVSSSHAKGAEESAAEPQDHKKGFFARFK